MKNVKLKNENVCVQSRIRIFLHYCYFCNNDLVITLQFFYDSNYNVRIFEK